MGVQRGSGRRSDWLWRPLKRCAGRGAGGGSVRDVAVEWRWEGAAP